MVTRRAVLKGTAAASIGAIAAAHGATPAEASIGYGTLSGGAVGGFYKYRDAFQVALKFHKISADIFFKEAVSGGVDVFLKFFDKEWSTAQTAQLSESFYRDLQTSDLYFSKIEVDRAQFFLKDRITQRSVQGSFTLTKEGVDYSFVEQPYNPDGDIS
jgi:hypothetical protein